MNQDPGDPNNWKGIGSGIGIGFVVKGLAELFNADDKINTLMMEEDIPQTKEILETSRLLSSIPTELWSPEALQRSDYFYGDTLNLAPAGLWSPETLRKYRGGYVYGDMDFK